MLHIAGQEQAECRQRTHGSVLCSIISLPYAAAPMHLLMLSRLAFLISEHHLYQSRMLL